MIPWTCSVCGKHNNAITRWCPSNGGNCSGLNPYTIPLMHPPQPPALEPQPYVQPTQRYPTQLPPPYEGRTSTVPSFYGAPGSQVVTTYNPPHKAQLSSVLPPPPPYGGSTSAVPSPYGAVRGQAIITHPSTYAAQSNVNEPSRSVFASQDAADMQAIDRQRQQRADEGRERQESQAHHLRPAKGQARQQGEGDEGRKAQGLEAHRKRLADGRATQQENLKHQELEAHGKRLAAGRATLQENLKRQEQEAHGKRLAAGRATQELARRQREDEKGKRLAHKTGESKEQFFADELAAQKANASKSEESVAGGYRKHGNDDNAGSSKERRVQGA